MVPMDGKNFFANDVMRSAFSGASRGSSDDSSEDAAPTTTASAQRKPSKRP